MSGEFFKGVKQWEFDREGRKAKLPLFYYDNTAVTAIYTAATRRVKDLLPHAHMNPIEIYPSRCLVAFTAFEYRKSDIDPYNEFSISFLIAFDKPQIPGVTAAIQMARNVFTAHVWQLPVTTEIARVGGVEMYGYPKFIADIDFQRDENWIECTLSEDAKKILSLKGRLLPTAMGKVKRFITYSVLDGIPLAANVYQNPLKYAESKHKDSALLELGDDHPISASLRGIELSPSPLMYQYSPVNEAILFAGRNLMDS